MKQDDVEQESKADWLSHPYANVMRKRFADNRFAALTMLISKAQRSPDPDVREAYAAYHRSDEDVAILGGKKLLDEVKRAGREERNLGE